MEILEKLYENPPIITNFLSRKHQIKSPKTIVKGSAKSGKTYIILDFLKQQKSKFLYIDLQDLRLSLNDIANLDKFIEKENIQTLVIENYDFGLKLANLENIILSSRDSKLSINGFSELVVLPLDFEEFISFSRKNYDLGQLFSLYANLGRLPEFHLKFAQENVYFLQNWLKNSLNELELKVFSKICNYQAMPFSIHKVYQDLKQEIKISKDKVYEIKQKFIDFSYIYEISRFDSLSATKKIYLENFALKEANDFKKDFLKLFANMIFCELYKGNLSLFYTKEIDFYIPKKNQAILSTPFTPPEFVLRKIKKISNLLRDLEVKEIFAISVSNTYKKKIDNFEFEMLPFSQWALSL